MLLLSGLTTVNPQLWKCLFQGAGKSPPRTPEYPISSHLESALCWPEGLIPTWALENQVVTPVVTPLSAIGNVPARLLETIPSWLWKRLLGKYSNWKHIDNQQHHIQKSRQYFCDNSGKSSGLLWRIPHLWLWREVGLSKSGLWAYCMLEKG